MNIEPFNLEKAKAGAKVVTRSRIEAKIIHYESPLVAIINNVAYNFDSNGKFQTARENHKYDLFIISEKQTADEENEQGKADVLWCIEQARRHAKDENEMGTCWFAEKWLEKQGDHIANDSKKVEWSEEDEKCRNALINICSYPHDEMDGRPWGKWINWLKSIKPNHWKPSEYDISLLEEIARNIRNDVRPFCSEVSALEDLIQNIKTL